MNLSNLVSRVHKDERVKDLRLRKDEVKIVVEVLIEHIINGLFEFGFVKIRGLFTIKVKKSKGRKISNPQTREEMYVEDYYKLNLEPSKKIKENLEELRESQK